jgi:hypothetical protein
MTCNETGAEADAIIAIATGTVESSLYKDNTFFRSLRDVPANSAAQGQAPFGAGGFRWKVMDNSERKETSLA